MGFIPIDSRGQQAYPYDSRSWRAKLVMWFWKRFSRRVLGKTFYMEHVTGKKTLYRNCVFRHCRFDGLRMVFVVDSLIEYSTPVPEFHNMNLCEITRCVFKKVEPVAENLL